jgi:hypothetical protein
VHFPLHLAFKNIRPFIMEDEELVDALRTPIRYRDAGGSIGEGIPGQVLRRICSVWVRAQRSGVLGPSQEKIAEKAQILLDALADVAIVALIDEATGYQKRRAHDALQKILSAYISPELLPWQSRFPVSFYEQLYKVMGWKYDASSTARSVEVGKAQPASRGSGLADEPPTAKSRLASNWALDAQIVVDGVVQVMHSHPTPMGDTPCQPAASALSLTPP